MINGVTPRVLQTPTAILQAQSFKPHLARLLHASAPRYSTKGARVGGATNRGFFRLHIHFKKREKTTPVNNTTTVVVGEAGAARSHAKHALRASRAVP